MGFFSKIKKAWKSMTGQRTETSGSQVAPSKLTPALSGMPAAATPGAIAGVSPTISPTGEKGVIGNAPSTEWVGKSRGEGEGGGDYKRRIAAQEAETKRQADIKAFNEAQAKGEASMESWRLGNVNTIREAAGLAPRTDTKLTPNQYFTAIVGGIWAGTVATALSRTALSQIATIGTTGLSAAIPGTAGKIAVNSATTIATTSMVTKLGLSTGAAGLLLTTIGSYPFAGFIKEEALQTLSYGVTAAVRNGDWEGAEAAFALQEEILNPGTWKQLVAMVPFANVLDSLDDFYEAATIKLAIDRKMVSDMQQQEETGETESEKWARLKQEEADQYKSNVDYNIAMQKDLFEFKQRALNKGRDEDARFWADYAAEQRELEAADRQAIADFWFAYRKATQKFYDEQRPSKLNFGIV